MDNLISKQHVASKSMHTKRTVICMVAMLVLSTIIPSFSYSNSKMDTDFSVLASGQTKRSIEPVASAIDALPYERLPTFSAVLKKYNQRDVDNATNYWVQLSPMGMRVRDVEGHSEVIKNFDQQRVWLINTKNKTSLEVDVEFYRSHSPDDVQHLIGPSSVSNVPGTEACADLIGVNNGKRSWRGQIVDEWLCMTEQGVAVNTQLYSRRWSLVVQVKHTDLNVEELVDIREEFFKPDKFRPDESLQRVGPSEFIGERSRLDTFSP